jgi:predicted 3-demethylubiquinone-9 3-methyltransferase (glyoxalase superfamily)
MPIKNRITPFLWFDHQAEKAANFYVSIFPNSRINEVVRYGEAGREHHGREPGSVMVVSFELDGQPIAALNGGPLFTFNEALSLVINCETQDEVDHYWNRLTEGGDPRAQQCGWLKDKFGVSWQVVPTVVTALLGSPESAKSQAAFAAIMPMKKVDIAAVQAAYDAAEG